MVPIMNIFSVSMSKKNINKLRKKCYSKVYVLFGRTQITLQKCFKFFKFMSNSICFGCFEIFGSNGMMAKRRLIGVKTSIQK